MTGRRRKKPSPAGDALLLLGFAFALCSMTATVTSPVLAALLLCTLALVILGAGFYLRYRMDIFRTRYRNRVRKIARGSHR